MGQVTLYFPGVKQIYADGTQRDVDPAAYLAEIAQKGHIKQQVLHNGNDLLARYKGTEENVTGKSLSPDAWMKNYSPRRTAAWDCQGVATLSWRWP